MCTGVRLHTSSGDEPSSESESVCTISGGLGSDGMADSCAGWASAKAAPAASDAQAPFAVTEVDALMVCRQLSPSRMNQLQTKHVHH